MTDLNSACFDEIVDIELFLVLKPDLCTSFDPSSLCQKLPVTVNKTQKLKSEFIIPGGELILF